MSLVTITLERPTVERDGKLDVSRLMTLARTAEIAGFDRVSINEHVVMGADTQDFQWGRFPFGPDQPWLDPIVTLSAIAAQTSRIRLETSILIAPLRRAPNLAKAVATLDVISNGRIDLGVGTGWHRAEFDASAVRFEDRGQVLTDTIGACRALWTQSPASFQSDTLGFNGVWCEPKPRQPRLPVWFSGNLTPRTLNRIIELGDGWLPIMNATLDAIATDSARLRERWTRAQRTGIPSLQVPLRSVADTPAAALEQRDAVLRAGITDLKIALRALSKAEDVDLIAQDLAAFVARFRQAFS